MGSLVAQLRRRSFGGILIVLAALGLVPGVSIISGLLMCFVGLQMFSALTVPYLPRYVRNKEIDPKLVRVIGRKCIAVVAYIEKYSKPRWLNLTRRPSSNALGLVVITLGIVSMLPLPLSNVPPALALLSLSVGLLERDGVVVAFGIVASFVAIAIGFAISFVAIQALLLYLQ